MCAQWLFFEILIILKTIVISMFILQINIAYV